MLARTLGPQGGERAISASSGLGLLQMVSEPDTEWCASENVGPSKEMNYEISHRLERRTRVMGGLGCYTNRPLSYVLS